MRHRRRMALGNKLRTARRARGWTLDDVEERTDGRWKASTVGAYERGGRTVSVPVLFELADLYGVSPGGLLQLGGPVWVLTEHDGEENASEVVGVFGADDEEDRRFAVNALWARYAKIMGADVRDIHPEIFGDLETFENGSCELRRVNMTWRLERHLIDGGLTREDRDDDVAR